MRGILCDNEYVAIFLFVFLTFNIAHIRTRDTAQPGGFMTDKNADDELGGTKTQKPVEPQPKPNLEMDPPKAKSLKSGKPPLPQPQVRPKEEPSK